MSPSFRIVVSFAVGAVLAACSTGAQRSILPQSFGMSALRARSVSRFGRAGANASVTIEILVPKTAPTIAPQFVSPATKSLKIAVSLKGKIVQSTAVNLSVRSKGCKKSSKGLACIVKLSLAPAKYTASFSTYSGPVKKGKPTGKELSADQRLPLKVPSKGLSVAVTDKLGGIPAKVAFVPSGDSQLSGGPAKYTMSRCGFPESADILGVDAAGYEIIGSGAPTVSLTSSNSSYLKVATSTQISPNEFLLITTPLSPPPLGSTVVLTASAKPTAASGAKTVSNKVTVAFNSSFGCVTEHYLASSSSLAGYAVAATLGPDGNIWVTGSLRNDAEIFRVVPSSGAIAPFSAGFSGGSPGGIAVGPDGNLWFAPQSNSEPEISSSLSFMTTNGSVSSVAVTSGLTSCDVFPVNATTIGSSIWFSDTCDQIGSYTPSTARWIMYNASGTELTEGPDGNVWFVDGGASVSKLVPGNPVVSYPLSYMTAEHITAGSDGNLWFSAGGYQGLSGAFIGKITTAGGVTTYRISGYSQPPLIEGPDGNVWFIGVSSGSSSGGYPVKALSTIAEISHSGIVTSYALPWGVVPSGPLVFDGTGNLWFIAGGGSDNRIDEFQLH